MYIKWHLILISIYVTANVVEYLFSDLITSDFSLCESFIYSLPIFLDFVSFSYLFIGMPSVLTY